MEKSSVINSLKGESMGDAFGIGIEFKSRLWMAKNVDFTKFINVRKGGNNNIFPGDYSDDTEHTIGVVEALLSDQVFSEKLLLEKFKQEYENDKEKKGHPRDGHGSIESWYTGKKTIEEIRQSQASREDPGNAPVMRALPLAFVDEQDVENYSLINANSTHPNPLSVKASLLTILTARHFLRNNGSKDNLFNYLMERISDAHTQEWLNKINNLPEQKKLTEEQYNVLHGKQPLEYIAWGNNVYGLPCAAFKTALNVAYVLKYADSAFDALKMSIRMGGDVDSLAAVCTGIAGGSYGLDSLPTFLLEQTEGLDRMESLGTQLFNKYSTPEYVHETTH